MTDASATVATFAAHDFPPLRNDRLLMAARQEPVDQVPVWLMRQAGRYLPEFRAVRARHDFFTVCRTPELACEVTLQPLRRFHAADAPLDASIIFSDILVVPQALGMEVQMVKGKGPHFPDPLDRPADLDQLRRPDVREALGYVFEALTLTRREIGGAVPLFGFTGAPWTLMAYMIEGGGSKNYAKAKAWLYADPDASHRLLQLLTDVIVDYLVAQVGAGAQALQVFDSHAGALTPSAFASFGYPYLAQIAERVKARVPSVPLVVFARGAHYALDALAATDYDVVGLDETVMPAAARAIVAGRAAVQGNLDNAALYASPDTIRALTGTMLDGFRDAEGQLTGLIGNLGHGMLPNHNPDHAIAYVRAIHELSRSTPG
ncbi:MAG: uroporphyrinogen decarboxylase [Bacteroidota bacterium]